MGILNQRDVYSSKYITAEITDSSGHIFYVPIKNVIGDYFLADIEKQLYCFKIDYSRLKIYRHTAVKSFRKLYYDTNHYMPISPENNKELDDILRINSLPHVDNQMLGIFKQLGRSEKHSKKEFEPHSIQDFLAQSKDIADQYPEEVKNLKTYLDNLGIQQIVTPVKKISEFLEGDLITTDPRFLGTIISAFQRLDLQQNKMNNTPIGGKKSWVKIVAIVVGIALIGAVIAIGWQMGWFSHLTPTFTTGGAASTIPQADLLKQYPTPESMVTAIHDGNLDCKKLTTDIVKMVNNFKGGTCP